MVYITHWGLWAFFKNNSTSVESCNIVAEFLPFGVENGDVQVAAGSPTVGPIGLQPPLVLYGSAETEFYVSTT